MWTHHFVAREAGTPAAGGPRPDLLSERRGRAVERMRVPEGPTRAGATTCTVLSLDDNRPTVIETNFLTLANNHESTKPHTPTLFVYL